MSIIILHVKNINKNYFYVILNIYTIMFGKLFFYYVFGTNLCTSRCNSIIYFTSRCNCIRKEKFFPTFKLRGRGNF